MDAMSPDLPTVTATLWRADAVALFDWLTVPTGTLCPFTQPAQKQVLTESLTRLELHAVPGISSSIPEDIAAAQDELAKDIGW